MLTLKVFANALEFMGILFVWWKLRFGSAIGVSGVDFTLFFLVQQIESVLVETNNVEYETPHAWTEYIAPMGEYGAERGAGPFEGAAVPRDAEGHVGRGRLDANVPEEFDEVCWNFVSTKLEYTIRGKDLRYVAVL